MTIHALEAGDPLTVDARSASTRPPTSAAAPSSWSSSSCCRSSCSRCVGRQTPLVMVVEPDPAHPGHRRGRLRAAAVRGAAPREPDRQGAALPGPARPDDHDQAADRRHDRGRHRVDGAGARRRRRSDPATASSSSVRCASTGPSRAIEPPHHRLDEHRQLRPTRRQGMSDLDDQARRGRTRSTTRSRRSWSRPETSTDPAAIRRLGQELSQLEPVVEAFRRLEATRAELAGAREVRDASDADDELKAMARDEIDRLEADETRLIEELQGPAPAARPERRPRRHPRDPGRRRRRGGGPVRRRALPDVRPLRRAPPLHARAAEPQRDRASAGSRRRSSRSTATAPTAGSSSRAASIASSASRRPNRPAASTPRP